MYLSIDCGTKNFAYARMRLKGYEILECKCIDYTAMENYVKKDNKQDPNFCYYVRRYTSMINDFLEEQLGHGVTKVIIENQMLTNAKCMVVQSLVCQFCELKSVDYSIVDPKMKTSILFWPHIDQKNKESQKTKKGLYALNKKISVKHVSLFFKDFVEEAKKERNKVDDLCDTILQLISFDVIKNNALSVSFNKGHINMSYPGHCRNCGQNFTVEIIDELLKIRDLPDEERVKAQTKMIFEEFEFNICCAVALQTFLTADQFQDYQNMMMRHYKKLKKG